MKCKHIKFLVALFFLTFLTSRVYSQAAFEKKTVLLNGGAVLYGGMTPVTVSAEYGLTNSIGLGVRSYFARGRSRSLLNGALYADYHFARLRRVDLFGGLMLDKPFYFNERREGFAFNEKIGLNAQAGARYLFANRIGVYAQVVVPFQRGDEPSLELGISVKF